MTGGDWKTALYIFEHKNHPTPAVFFVCVRACIGSRYCTAEDCGSRTNSLTTSLGSSFSVSSQNFQESPYFFLKQYIVIPIEAKLTTDITSANINGHPTPPVEECRRNCLGDPSAVIIVLYLVIRSFTLTPIVSSPSLFCAMIEKS